MRLDGRIELRELLGQGGMGEVHAAWDRSLARPVAVKFVRGPDPRGAERLLLEARLQARVEHAHVVRVFEVGSLEGRPCILLQLVQGRPLDALARELPVAERVELVRQAATGVHAAHLQGLVHRDVKPGNVLVETLEGGARISYVTDFGLAHAEEGGLTRSGILPGTLDFMAPEQLAGGGPVDFRADVYALGATLYAVLAGRPPFRLPSAAPDGSGEAQVSLLRRILDEEPPALANLVPAAPRELAVICAKAMEKEPAARYPSAEAFAEDLARFQRGEPIHARPPTAGERIGKWVRRNRTASRALAAALALLAAAGGFSLWQAHRAGAEALEAARLGGQAAELESRLRMEYLSPPHDLRPALAAVRAEVEALRPLAVRSSGPASFALGKGLELVGELDEARASYERAWSRGFRSPATAEGLGTVLGRLFQREYAIATDTLAPGARASRVAELEATLREPARRYLEQGVQAGWRGPFLRAQVALIEGDLAGARERAAETLKLDPGRYEARVLEGEAWIKEARLLDSQDHLREAAAAIDRAAPTLEAATAAGRSDPRAHRLLAEALGFRARLLATEGKDPTAAYDVALQAFERAALLDADDPSLLLGRGRLLKDRSGFEGLRGNRRALELSAEACDLLRRAARAAPRDPAPLLDLAHELYRRSFMIREWTGGEPEKEVEEAVRATAAALTLAPGRADVVRGRAISLFALATDQQARGKDSTPALEEFEARCREAEQLDPKRAASLREIRVEGGRTRAREDWRRGADPRPAFEQALAVAEQMLAASTGRRAAATQAGSLYVEYAMVLMDMGEDPAAQTKRGLTLVDQDVAQHPGLATLEFVKGQFLVVEAMRQVLAGADPRASVAEARRLIASASAGEAAMSNLSETWGWVADIEARWLAAGHGDPSAALDRCEREYERTAAVAKASAAGPKGIATCALVRAAWLARRSAPAAADAARRGLDQARRAAALDPRDPVILVRQARLQGLAGDSAGGRSTLAAAYAAQPLLRGSWDGKAAEAELR